MGEKSQQGLSKLIGKLVYWVTFFGRNIYLERNAKKLHDSGLAHKRGQDAIVALNEA